MKKLILLLTVSFSILAISCSNDDDGNQDPIIGSWKLSQEFENGELITSDPCDLEGVVIFSEDGSLRSEFYEENGDGNCELAPDGVDTGTWINSGDNVYSFTVDGDTSEEEINFSGNTFSIEYSDTFDGQTTEYRDVFVKI
ncbi:lipocalin-like domain-containing protein [Aquimarina sp. M1]